MPDEKTTSPPSGSNVLRLPLEAHLHQLLDSCTNHSMAGTTAGETSGGNGQRKNVLGPNRDDDGETPEHLAKRMVSALDVDAWMAWELVGLQLWSGAQLPTMHAFSKAARRVLLLNAIERCDGNITRMASALGISRRALRQHLKAARLYVEPSPQIDAPDDRQTREPAAVSTEVEIDSPNLR